MSLPTSAVYYDGDTKAASLVAHNPTSLTVTIAAVMRLEVLSPRRDS